MASDDFGRFTRASVHEPRYGGDEVPEVIHWLHLSDGDVSKARRIIDAFKEDDTPGTALGQPFDGTRQ